MVRALRRLAMRTPASIVVRYFAVAVLGASVAFGCGESSSSSEDGGGGEGTGGDAASGGNSSGGTSGSGGGGSGATSGGSGSGTGGAATGGTGAIGGSGAGTAGDGGSAGSATGGSAQGGSGGASSGGSAGSSGGLGGTPSTGCNAARVPASGRFTIDVSGTEREYILKLPPAYDVTSPRAYRLFVLFHGAAYSAQSVADGGPPGMTGPYYGIETASAGAAILVAAQALSTSWSDQGGRDVAYVNAMIARFKTELCIDESRIFAVGFSRGAIMTSTLGCTNDTTFRGIAPMSGSLPSPCNGTRPIAWWSSHGTNDMTIRPVQGEAVRDAFLERNGCGTTTLPGEVEGCSIYQDCDVNGPVEWCTFEGVHEPPPYAGEAIWAFFSQLEPR